MNKQNTKKVLLKLCSVLHDIVRCMCDTTKYVDSDIRTKLLSIEDIIREEENK